MTPMPVLRQAPIRWQRSAAAAHAAVLGERAAACAAGRRGGSAGSRRSAVIGAASTITPGLRRPCGSNSALTLRNAS